MDEPFALRPETEEDIEFLARLYATTREAELRPVDWPAEQKAMFVQQQFDAQRLHYRTHYDKAEFAIIVVEGRPIGRLYVQRQADDIRLMDIALMPEYCGRGIGGKLIARLLEEGRATGRSVSIHVEVFNPAMRLYERLGFQKIDSYGVYHLMEWRPESA